MPSQTPAGPPGKRARVIKVVVENRVFQTIKFQLKTLKNDSEFCDLSLLYEEMILYRDRRLVIFF